jgi:hypothetical protein
MVLTPWYRNSWLGLAALRDDSVVHQSSGTVTEYDDLVPRPADHVAKSFPGQTCSDQATTAARRSSRGPGLCLDGARGTICFGGNVDATNAIRWAR